MNYNPNNVSEGEKVILDKDFNNASIVEVVTISFPQQLFAIVKDDDGNSWETMTNRLSKILNDNSGPAGQ